MKRLTPIILAIALLPSFLAATAISVNAPPDATYIVQTANGVLSGEQALSSLSTGVMKVTTTTGAITTAVANTDYAAADGDLTALAALTGTSTVYARTGTSTWTALAANGICKCDGSGVVTAATAGTDYYKTGATTSPGAIIGLYGVTASGQVYADSTTYYFGAPIAMVSGTQTLSTTAGRRRFYFTSAGTLTKAYITVVNEGGTAGTNETSTMTLQINGSDTDTLSSSIVTSATGAFNNTSISRAVAAGDYAEIKVVSPVLATNPTNICFGVQLEFHP